MEMHQLHYFTAAEQYGNFTRAAEKCNVSQPSLSAQISKLEKELGGILIERSRGGCRLTPRGEVFLPRAREILRQAAEVRHDIREFDSGRSGVIRLGCLPTTGAYVLPPLLSAYRRDHPNVRIILSEGSSPVLAQRLEEHQVDSAIMDQAGMNESLSGTILFSEPLYIALPTAHPLVSQGELGLESLAGQSLILMRKGHGFNRIVTAALRRAGVEPQIVYESSEIETVQALVRAGLGISIVPRMICVHEDIAYRRVSGDAPRRTLLMARRKSASQSPAAKELAELAARDLGALFGGE